MCHQGYPIGSMYGEDKPDLPNDVEGRNCAVACYDATHLMSGY